jgi:hypothetical protein
VTTAVTRSAIGTLAALLALVGRSQIVLADPAGEGAAKSRLLPAGFDDVDVAILEWIAAEGRRIGRHFARV